MPGADLTLHTYEEIAEAYQEMGDAEQRDIFLVLAADVAASAGYADVAEQHRLRLLTLTPHHLLRPYATFTEALQSADIRIYIDDLLRRHPPEQAGQLLDDLRARQHSAAARDLLFAHPGDGDQLAGIRVYQQMDEMRAAEKVAPAGKAKAAKPEGPAEAARLPAPAAPSPRGRVGADPGRPINLTSPPPWLQEKSLYEADSATIMDPGGDPPDVLGNWVAVGLFVLAGALTAALFGATFILPLFVKP
jgi:hypothetical protein